MGQSIKNVGNGFHAQSIFKRGFHFTMNIIY